MFNKPRSHIETVNDLDGNVVGLFRCIKEDPERLAKQIYLTPYSRDIYERTFQEEPQDRFEAALYFFIRSNMGQGFRADGKKVGWKTDVQGRERAYAAKEWCGLPEKIIQAAERLRGVQIEDQPAVGLIKRYNFENVLIYCDPPYMLGTRYGKQYRYEMDDREHERLLEALIQHKGPVLISGYDTALYQDMLNNWERREHISRTQSGAKKQEVLWMNFKPGGQMVLDL